MLPERTSCPPDRRRRRVDSQATFPIDAVFAIDRWNPYLPSVFVPQQVVVYPQVEVTFENEDEMFAGITRFYNERLRASRVQPFFNSVETPQERAAFVDALGVTHVLVDPAYYREMRRCSTSCRIRALDSARESGLSTRCCEAAAPGRLTHDLQVAYDE